MKKNIKRSLFLDFDGLQFDTLPAQTAYLNKKYGIKTSEDDYITNLSLEEVVNKYLAKLGRRQMKRDDVYRDLGKEFLASIELHKGVLPMKDMREIVPLLAKKYMLWTVTARQKIGIKTIRYLLNEHIPGCMSGIHCVSEQMEDGKFKEVSKKNFINGVHGEKWAFIDDSLSEVLETKDSIDSFLFDPYGFSGNFTNLEVVKSWDQIGEIFL